MADDEAPKLERNEAGEFVCPECGETFKLALHAGVHRRQKHGVKSPNAEKNRKETERRRAKRGRDSAPSSRPEPARKTRIARMLRDVANLSDDIRGRESIDLPEQLSDVIRRDADQLATLLNGLAETFNPFKSGVDLATRVLAPALAASGVLRWMLRAWRRQLDQREQEPPELTPEQAAALADEEAQASWRAEHAEVSNQFIPPGAHVPSSVAE